MLNRMQTNEVKNSLNKALENFETGQIEKGVSAIKYTLSSINRFSVNNDKTRPPGQTDLEIVVKTLASLTANLKLVTIADTIRVPSEAELGALANGVLAAMEQVQAYRFPTEELTFRAFFEQLDPKWKSVVSIIMADQFGTSNINALDPRTPQTAGVIDRTRRTDKVRGVREAVSNGTEAEEPGDVNG